MGVNALTEVSLKARAGKELVLEALRSAMEGEIRILQVKLAGFEGEMREFESRYKLSSSDFYERFEGGELGDDEDYFNWWAAVHAYESVKARIETLQELLGQCKG